MATFEYTAKRTFALGHVVNSLYTIDLDIQSATPAYVDVKSIERSPGGGIEISFERQDVIWTIKFAPVGGYELELMREFLDSTESGELFRVWIWPEDAFPLALKRLEDGHTEDAFMRRGSESADLFEGQFSALQMSPYDPSGAASESGGMPGGALGGGGGGTVDVYDPDNGGLDPDLVAGPLTFTAGTGTEFFYRGYSAINVSTLTSSGTVPMGTLISGDVLGYSNVAVFRDTQNFAFPLLVVIETTETPADPENAFFAGLQLRDDTLAALGSPYVVGAGSNGSNYSFADHDLGGGVHQYAWRWEWFSPASGVQLSDGQDYSAEFY